MLSLRIVTTSAVLLALAAGSASAQTATTTAAGKPLPLLQIFQKNEEDTATIKPRHRARYAHRRVVRTRVTNHPAGAIHHAFMEVQPEPDAAQPDTTPATTTQAVNATAAPANIWPTPDLTLPGTEGLTPISTTASMTPVPIAGPPLTPAAPATPDNPNEPLAAAYHTVQLAPQVAPLVAPQIAPEVTPTNTAPATPPSPVQVAQADMLSPTDATADHPHDAANAAKASNPVASWPDQHTMVATAEPQNPIPVGSPIWIAHVLAALGGAVGAGALAWILINPLPARRYE